MSIRAILHKGRKLMPRIMTSLTTGTRAAWIFMQTREMTVGERNVGDSLYYDTSDLNNYGDWRTYGDYGNVWVPHMYAGWRPYNDGRWLYTNGSYFWASYEPWGWAPYHYGRWDWSLDFGWYWIPGYTFAPAWVSWYDYGDYIGWCPLNYHNYPVYYYNPGTYYSPIQKQKTIGVNDSWTFVRKGALGDPSIKKISASAAEIKNIRIDKEHVMLQPEKSLVPFVAGKGNRKAGTTFQSPSVNPTRKTLNDWNTGGASKAGSNDRQYTNRNTGSTGSSSKQGIGTSQKSSQPPPSSNKGGSSSSVNKGSSSSSSSKKTPAGSSSSTKKPSPPNYQRNDQFDRYVPGNYYSGSKLSRELERPNNRDRQFSTWGTSRQDSGSRNIENWKAFRDSNSHAGR